MEELDSPFVLTGIKPTGEPHVGNFLGAIEPALREAEKVGVRSAYFVADLHALNQQRDPRKLNDYIRSVAATWLACGLSLARSDLYRQSDVAEVAELAVVLAAVTPKGLMNRAHAYKAAVEANRKRGRDADEGVDMGLYTYPILMGADILAVGATVVPVGEDQVQHIEIARDIATRFNQTYGKCLVVPEYKIVEGAGVVPGTDGQKMSKSYGNTIPLWVSGEEWRKIIRKIPTDSAPIGQIRNPEAATVYRVYRSLADQERAEQMCEDLKSGRMGWARAKEMLVEVLEERFGPMRNKFFELRDSPERLENIFEQGAERISPTVKKTLGRVKKAVGIR